MEDKPHPIALQQVFFTRTVIIAIPGHAQYEKKGEISPGPTNSLDLTEIDGEPGFYQVTMKSCMNENGLPTDPYIIDMECVGIFHADQSLSSDEAKRGVTITAHSVLYGAIREAVAWITGRQPFGTFMLGLSVLKSSEKPKTE